MRLRDSAQFERLQLAKQRVGLSVNEYILRALESQMVEDLLGEEVADDHA